jgi:transposase
MRRKAMPRKAPKIALSQEEREKLERLIRKETAEQREVLRAKIILLANEEKENKDIAAELGISQQIVSKWRKRFSQERKEGLGDKPRPGKPKKFDHGTRLKVIEIACRKPEKITHWSTRELARKVNKELSVDISHMTVQRILSASDLKPHQVEMWVNSRDPDFETKMIDIVGLYLNPPENALVLSVDEKTSIQALGRKSPPEPMEPGKPERVDHEYVRHGTKSLMAALLVHKGEVMGKCYDRHRHQEFLDFLKHIETSFYEKELHLIVDNFSSHKHEKVKEYLKKKKDRIFLHFTPTHASWLNQIELWFSILSRKLLKRGIFNSKKELVDSIMKFIKQYNREAKPFRWTYKGEPLRI